MMDPLEQLPEEIAFRADLAVALFEQSPDAILVVESNGEVRMVNRQAEFLFGYHRSELHDKPIEMLLPEPLRDRHLEHRRGFIADPRVRAMGSGLDLRGRHKNGSEIAVEINLSPIVTARGLFVIAVIRRTTKAPATRQQPLGPAVPIEMPEIG